MTILPLLNNIAVDLGSRLRITTAGNLLGRYSVFLTVLEMVVKSSPVFSLAVATIFTTTGRSAGFQDRPANAGTLVIILDSLFVLALETLDSSLLF